MSRGFVFLRRSMPVTPIFFMTSDVQRIGEQNTIVFNDAKRHCILHGGKIALTPPPSFSAHGVGLWLPENIKARRYESKTMAILEVDNPVVAGAALTAHAIYSIAATRKPTDLTFGADNTYGGCFPVYLAWATSGKIAHVGEPENIAFRLASLLNVVIAREELSA